MGKYGEPFKHTPEIDWGFVQNRHGETAIRVTTGLYQDDDILNQHRKNRTDPTEPHVSHIVACLNACADRNPSALAELERAVEAISFDRLCSCQPFSEYVCAICRLHDALSAWKGGAE